MPVVGSVVPSTPKFQSTGNMIRCWILSLHTSAHIRRNQNRIFTHIIAFSHITLSAFSKASQVALDHVAQCFSRTDSRGHKMLRKRRPFGLVTITSYIHHHRHNHLKRLNYNCSVNRGNWSLCHLHITWRRLNRREPSNSLTEKRDTSSSLVKPSQCPPL